jgi:hypothetical protein
VRNFAGMRASEEGARVLAGFGSGRQSI